MRIQDQIHQFLLRLGQQAGQPLRAIAERIRRRQQRVAEDRLEVERLDRIRQPWKYRGK